MKKIPSLFLVVAAIVLTGFYACNNASPADSKAAADLKRVTDTTPKASGDVVSVVVDGHTIQIDKNDPNSVTIDGKKGPAVIHQRSDGDAPANLKGADISAQTNNGKKVTVYSYSACTNRRDTFRNVSAATH